MPSSARDGSGLARSSISPPEGRTASIGDLAHCSWSQFGIWLALTSLPAGRGTSITGLAASDLLGLAAAGIGDLNHDGIGDLLLAAPGRDGAGEDAGAAWVIFGSTDPERGPIDLAHLETDTGFALTGPSEGATAGWSVAGLGDINGDGRDDLIWRNNTDGGVAGWLMNGASSTSQAMIGGAPSQWQIAGIGDFNFDGAVSDRIQNGAPDAIRLVLNNSLLVDALSYEGSVTGAVEGSGTLLNDDGTVPIQNLGLSRTPDSVPAIRSGNKKEADT